MFCSKSAYLEFTERSGAGATVTPLWDSSLPHEWPSFDSVSSDAAVRGDFELGHSEGALDQSSFDAGPGDYSDTCSSGGEGGAPP
jgi:hypothetical protein